MPLPPVKGGTPIGAPQQGGHALTPTCPDTTSQAIREKGRASPARGGQLQWRPRGGSLVVLVVLVARQSGPVQVEIAAMRGERYSAEHDFKSMHSVYLVYSVSASRATKELDIPSTQSNQIYSKLHIHSIHTLHKLVQLRRSLERSPEARERMKGR